MLQVRGTFWKETFSHLSAGYFQYTSNASYRILPNGSQNLKRNINRKRLRKKNAFQYCRRRSGRLYRNSSITLRLKCGLGKSSFQESFKLELFSDSFDLDKSRDTAMCKMEGKALAMQEVELVVRLVEALRELLADGKIQKLMLAVFFFKQVQEKVAAGASGCNLVIFLSLCLATAQRFSSLTHGINFTSGNIQTLNSVQWKKSGWPLITPHVALTLIPNIPNSFWNKHEITFVIVFCWRCFYPPPPRPCHGDYPGLSEKHVDLAGGCESIAERQQKSD